MKKLTCITIATLMAITVAFSGCSNDSGSGNTEATIAEATDTTVKTTGKKIHINDSTLGKIWITELEGVPKNNLNNDNFTTDTYKHYTENGNLASAVGIDVSSFSGDINWQKVKDSGVDFAMVRVGGRSYGEVGELYADDRAMEYISQAKAVGIKVGAYFFSQAINSNEAKQEAEYVKSLLGDIKLDYPVAYDWEIIKDDDARTDTVSPAQATECAKIFCDTIKSYGYTPMIYSPSSELYFKYDLTRLADFDIWYCEYADVPTFYYQFSMWQYSSTATIDGIDGTVDLNICFTNVANYD